MGDRDLLSSLIPLVKNRNKKMNGISTFPFEQFPLELYTKIIGGIDDSFDMRHLGSYRIAAEETLRSWVTLAMVSHQLFTNVMHALHSSTIFKSLVSQLSEDRESFSLHRAFRPSVDFVKNMSDPNRTIILFDQKNPYLQTRIRSFFDVFRRIDSTICTKSKELPVICNIVEFVPHFLFNFSMAKWVRPNTASMCKEHYKKRNGKETLSACLTALENLSITPPSTRQDSDERKKIITAIRYCPERLQKFSPNSLTNDAEYSLEYHLATGRMDAFLRLFEDKKGDENVALETVRRDGSKLTSFLSFNNNKQVVLAAVQNHGSALQHAHNDLKKDKEIVLAAVKSTPWSLQYAHEDLKKDKDIVLATVQNYGMCLIYAHEDMKKDKEIVLAAVQHHHMALHYAHDDLKQDKEIVLSAVQYSGEALQYAHKDMKKDRDIVLTAVQNRKRAFQYAHEDFKKDANIVFAAVQQDGRALQYADESLKRNEAIVFAAVREDGMALQYADASCKQNEVIALTAISQNPQALRHVPDLNDNREFILKAMNTNYCVFHQLNGQMQQDPEIIAIFNKNRRIWETEIRSTH